MIIPPCGGEEHDALRSIDHIPPRRWMARFVVNLMLVCVSAGVYFLSGKRMRGGPGAREEEKLLEWLRQSLLVWNRDKKEAESQACAA